MSAQPMPEYLDAAGIAERLGVKRESVWQSIWRGHLPEPDIVILGHKLWLVDTIEQWEKLKWQRHAKRPAIVRQEAARTPRRPPRIRRSGATLPKQPRAARKRTRAGASERPAVSSLTEQQASEIAAALRSSGVTCTTADVMLLVDHDGEGLDYERDVLRQRIVQRVKAGRR